MLLLYIYFNTWPSTPSQWELKNWGIFIKIMLYIVCFKANWPKWSPHRDEEHLKLKTKTLNLCCKMVIWLRCALNPLPGPCFVKLKLSAEAVNRKLSFYPLWTINVIRVTIFLFVQYVCATHLYTVRSPSCGHGHRCRTLPEAGQVWPQCRAEPGLLSAEGTSCWCWLGCCSWTQSLDFLAWTCWSRCPCRPQRATSPLPRTRTGESETPAALTARPPTPWQSHRSQSSGAGGPWRQSSWQTEWGPGCRFQSCWRWRPRRHSGGWNVSPEWWGHWPDRQRHGQERPKQELHRKQWLLLLYLLQGRL